MKNKNNGFNLNNNHPLIPNLNQYMCEKKYVSIHSIDRDSLKYPNSSLFEIELPQDYLNVQAIRLHSWSFPANYSVFRFSSNNLNLVFKFTNIYNPIQNGVNDLLLNAIYAGLNEIPDKKYIITIQEGFYNPIQMSTELTNKMNVKITDELNLFFTKNKEYNYALKLFTGYNDFTVIYNSVSQNMWFGNKNNQFELVNDDPFYREEVFLKTDTCFLSNSLPSFSDWALPSYLGFTRCPIKSTEAKTSNEYRFFYLDMNEGLWIKPSNLPGSFVNYLTAPLKINFLGPSYIYMELTSNSSFNNIDETEPFNISTFTSTTNQTNGIVNSAFAKIAVPTTPISQWFDDGSFTLKWFDPPMERFRKIKVKMRYHDGTLVDFAGFDYTFMLELTLFNPQIPLKYNINNSICGINF